MWTVIVIEPTVPKPLCIYVFSLTHTHMMAAKNLNWLHVGIPIQYS